MLHVPIDALRALARTFRSARRTAGACALGACLVGTGFALSGDPRQDPEPVAAGKAPTRQRERTTLTPRQPTPTAAPAAAPVEVPATTVPPPAAAAPAPPPTPAPPPPPPGPVVNQPPRRPNRVAPAPAPDRPPPAPSSVAVHPDDFPDPFVLNVGGTYWAFATQSGDKRIPIMRSTDLRAWVPAGDALANLPPWSEPGLLWAPAVLERPATFVLYYTTRHRATGLQCISVAVSVLPQGPYVDHSSEPLVCQMARGGSIDPDPFVGADGRPWLLWKSEGTLRGEPTRIWSQALSADGRSLVGPRHELLHQRLAWEFPIIEGPTMVLVAGRHHLFYSGNRWETPRYAVGHAVCAGPAGPCRRTGDRPVLAAGPSFAGPGGQAVATAPTGELVLVHHAWGPRRVGYPHGARRLHISALRFEGDRAVVGAPWRGPGAALRPLAWSRPAPDAARSSRALPAGPAAR